MKNRIEKSNKTKFDYVSRKLGVLGILIMIFTFAVGGPILAQVISENIYLTNTLTRTQTAQTEQKNQIQNENVEFIVEEGDQ